MLQKQMSIFAQSAFCAISTTLRDHTNVHCTDSQKRNRAQSNVWIRTPKKERVPFGGFRRDIVQTNSWSGLRVGTNSAIWHPTILWRQWYSDIGMHFRSDLKDYSEFEFIKTGDISVIKFFFRKQMQHIFWVQNDPKSYKYLYINKQCP